MSRAAPSRRAGESPVVALTLDALPRARALRGYAATLRAACRAAPPPFGMAWYGDAFRGLAMDVRWLAHSLVDNAAREGAGARDLWRLSARTRDPEVAEQIRQHAVDESRHALVYVAMLETALPGAASRRGARALRRLSPGYRPHHRPRAAPPLPWSRVLDELIQMNIGEIRTRVHQLLLTPVVSALCPAAGRRRLARMLSSLMADETRHIAYTAALIERATREGDGAFVRRTMARRLAEFNRITLAEVGRGLPCDVVVS